MRKLILIICMIVISGCDIDRLENHGYGNSFDYITDLGIKYRNDGDPENTLTGEYLNTKFLEVYNCIQNSGYSHEPASPNDLTFNVNLMVISVMVIDNKIEGRHYSNPSLILILDTDSQHHVRTTNYVISHELVHLS